MPTLGGTPEIIASPVFHEDDFDPRNLILYPLYRQTPADLVVAAHTALGRASIA
jgi:hypothetical protein